MTDTNGRPELEHFTAHRPDRDAASEADQVAAALEKAHDIVGTARLSGSSGLSLADFMAIRGDETQARLAFEAQEVLRQWNDSRTDQPKMWAEHPVRCSYCGDVTHNRTTVHGDGRLTCSLCFAEDHVIPQNQGGSWEAWNLIDACTGCNSSKGARTPAEWFDAGPWFTAVPCPLCEADIGVMCRSRYRSSACASRVASARLAAGLLSKMNARSERVTNSNFDPENFIPRSGHSVEGPPLEMDRDDRATNRCSTIKKNGDQCGGERNRYIAERAVCTHHMDDYWKSLYLARRHWWDSAHENPYRNATALAMRQIIQDELRQDDHE